MELQELVPSPYATLRPRFDVVLIEDHRHRLERNALDPQLAEFAQDAGVALGVLTR